MRSLLFKITLITVLFSGISCNSISGKENRESTELSEKSKVEIYYFHYTRRCATCMAVENVTKETLEKHYKKQLENEDVIFKSINLDDSGSEELAKKLEVSGQTLLIVADDKKENITTDAFLNAKSNPEKLNELLKSKIDSFLEK